MLAYLDAAGFSPGAHAPPAQWADSGPTPSGLLHESEPLAALTGEILGDRFRSWRGVSGRRYVFSVFDPTRCPAYCDAVAIAVVIEPNGDRRAIALADTGAFPEPVIARLTRLCAAVSERFEFHLHLLATTASERRATLVDLDKARFS
jgi:hypothetical protein